MPSSSSSSNPQQMLFRCVSSPREERSKGSAELSHSSHSTHSEPTFRSPRSPAGSDKPATEILLPPSPTSTTDFCIVFDESLEGSLPGSTISSNARQRIVPPSFALDPTFLNDDPSFFDDEVSEWSCECEEDGEWGGGEEQEEELLGLSFVVDELQTASA